MSAAPGQRRRWGKSAAWLLALAVCLGAVPAARAVVFEPREFDSPGHEQRYRAMIAELRCLVCQNQNLADSDAALAGDLRAEVFRMINEGHDDAQIVEFMVERYGDFVLYRPPWKLTTAMLWLAPLGLLLVGGLIALRAMSRSRQSPASGLSAEERERLARLVSGGKNSHGPETPDHP